MSLTLYNIQEIVTHGEISTSSETTSPTWRYHELKGYNSCCLYYWERKLAFLKFSSMQDTCPVFTIVNLAVFILETPGAHLVCSAVWSASSISLHVDACWCECQSIFSVLMPKVSIRQRELEIKVVLLVTRFCKWPVSLPHAQQKTSFFSKKTSSESTRQEEKGAGEGERETKNRRISFS